MSERAVLGDCRNISTKAKHSSSYQEAKVPRPSPEPQLQMPLPRFYGKPPHLRHWGIVQISASQTAPAAEPYLCTSCPTSGLAAPLPPSWGPGSHKNKVPQAVSSWATSVASFCLITGWSLLSLPGSASSCALPQPNPEQTHLTGRQAKSSLRHAYVHQLK